jgi:hypothetical protein
VSDRLDVRLDSDRRRKLSEVAAEYNTAISEAVRIMIDQAYEDVVQERRRQAARVLAAMAVEDVPDPEELSRQLSEAHEPTGLP